MHMKENDFRFWDNFQRVGHSKYRIDTKFNNYKKIVKDTFYHHWLPVKKPKN